MGDSSLDNKSTVDPAFSYICFVTSPGMFIFGTFCATHLILLFPLCIVVLHIGLQQLRKKRHPSSRMTISHSDTFAYHMASIELFGVLGNIMCICGSCTENFTLFSNGISVFAFTWYGQIVFHILTCVERYLAVVQPITYLSLRNKKGIRIRNISIGCAWLLSFAGFFVVMMKTYIFLDTFLLLFATKIIFFCSVSVLCVLIRPGPGEGGNSRAWVDKSKQRAFYTIGIILVVLMLRLSFNFVWTGFELSGKQNECPIITSGVWTSLLSSLVLPVLFLQRAGKLKCCTNNIRRAQDFHE